MAEQTNAGQQVTTRSPTEAEKIPGIGDSTLESTAATIWQSDHQVGFNIIV